MKPLLSTVLFVTTLSTVIAQTTPAPTTAPAKPPSAPARGLLNPAIPDLGPPPSSISVPHVNTAIIPYPQYYDDDLKVARGNIITFNNLHARNLARIKENPIDVLFIGDSITQFWSSAGRQVWNANFADTPTLHFANFGVSADRTQNVLWRLQNGEGEGYLPKVVILLVGTNNVGNEVSQTRFRNTGAEIAEGVKAIINEFQRRFPDVKILLFGIFPRGETDDKALEPMRRYVKEVNDIICKYDDGTKVLYVDIGPKFLDEQGNIKTGAMDGQKIHLARSGFEIWAAAIKEKLPMLLGARATVTTPAGAPATGPR